MQQLLHGIGAGNGSTGVPSVVGGKRKNEEDDSFSSTKKQRGKDVNILTMMSINMYIKCYI